MVATGIDLVLISRIKDIIKKEKNFEDRYFGEKEKQLFNSIKNEKKRIQTIAANFAGKEAFAKALKTGVSGFSLNEVEILRDKLGAPYISLNGKASKLILEVEKAIDISLSHTDEYAVAVVVICDNIS